MMWWLVIIAAPAALVTYELLDEDRRAVWAKRWARRRRFGGSVPVLSPEEWHVQVFGTEAPSVEMTREMLAETRPRAALDTSEWRDLLAHAKQGPDRRNGGSGLRSGGKIGLSVRRSLTEADECYTCGLLNRKSAGPHEHPFEDLVAAERVERDLRHPRRSKALWELVNHARRAAKRARASHLSLVEPARKPRSGRRRG